MTDIVGIDITKQGAIISFLSNDDNEPSTLSIEGQEASRIIPLSIAKEKELGRWYVGEEADRQALINGAHRIDDIFTKAYNGENVEVEDRQYSSEELFATFIRRIIESNNVELLKLSKLVITVPEVDIRVVEMFSALNSKLSLKKDVLTFVDHKESFIYYTLSQNQNIYTHDVALFEYESGRIYSYILNRNISTRPQVIEIGIDYADMETEDKDRVFCDFIEKTFEGRIITSVFLVGEGFNSDWMSESVDLLCKGRRVFFGDNLYSKGACYLGRIRLGKRPWNFVYIGDHEMKMNLSLKVSDRNDMSFFTLVEAGESWYDTGRECEVILDGSPEFECWIQSPESRKANVQKIELINMPKRENRTSRLRISAIPKSDKEVMLRVLDLGFGDIAPGSGRVWEHIINMEKEDE